MRYNAASARTEDMMAQLVLGIGTSHTPMLHAPPTDWPRFYERDSKRTNLLDTEGRLTSYDAQLKHAPAGIAGEIAPERMQVRHAAARRLPARGAARYADRDRRRPGGALSSRKHAGHPGLLRRDDPQRAAGAGGEPRLGMAGERPL